MERDQRVYRDDKRYPSIHEQELCAQVQLAASRRHAVQLVQASRDYESSDQGKIDLTSHQRDLAGARRRDHRKDSNPLFGVDADRGVQEFTETVRVGVREDLAAGDS